MDKSFVSTLLKNVSVESLVLVREELTRMESGKPNSIDEGICGNIVNAGDDSDIVLNDHIDLILDQFREWWQYWSEYSGSFNYPVGEHGDIWSVARDEFLDNDKWEGEYGASRMRLCRFLLQRLNLYMEFVHGEDSGQYLDFLRKGNIQLGMTLRDVEDPVNLKMIEDYGTCHILLFKAFNYQGCRKPMECFKRLMTIWPGFSGRADYPVPSGSDDVDSESVFYAVDNLWTNDYGRRRKDMVRFVIAAMEGVIYTLEAHGVE